MALAGLLLRVLSIPARAETRDLGRDTLPASGLPVDLLVIHNACHFRSERDLTADVGWAPVLHGRIDDAREADRAVARGAGAGRLR